MKVQITVEENVRYQSEVTVEQPESMSDALFEKVLEAADRKFRTGMCSSDDVPDVLNRLGLKVLDFATGFPSSPDDSELEIIDVMDVKEG